jgi:hypothetical protein
MTTLAVLLILVHDRGDLRLWDSGQKVFEYTTMLLEAPLTATVAHLTDLCWFTSILSGNGMKELPYCTTFVSESQFLLTNSEDNNYVS